MNPKEYKIILTGSMDAGKTTAIGAISEIAPIKTDVATTDGLSNQKQTTTVALDYGEITLEGGDRLRLYGTPGQKRFAFMWEVLSRGALGLVILVDNCAADPLRDLADYLDTFKDLIEQSGVVIGVSRTEIAAHPNIDEYYEFLRGRNQSYPLFAVDVRRKEDVVMLLQVLFTSIEAKGADPVSSSAAGYV